MENEPAATAPGISPERKSLKMLRRASIGMFIASLIGLAITNVQFSIVANRLVDEQEGLQAKFIDQSQRLKELSDWKARANKVGFKVHAQNEYLKAVLKKCKTREDFLVRDGEHIAFASTRINSTGRRTLFFLPAGVHVLNYSHAEFIGPTSFADCVQNFQRADSRSLKHPTRITLRGPEVYEIRCAEFGKTDMELTILGNEGREIHREVYKGDSRFLSLSKSSGLSFPNQRIQSYSGNFGEETEPVVDIGCMTSAMVKDRVTAIRFWIDSDAKPCMSAAQIALKYPDPIRLSSIGGVRPPEPISEYFEPYTGSSGKYFFRESTFPLPGLNALRYQLKKQTQFFEEQSSAKKAAKSQQ